MEINASKIRYLTKSRFKLAVECPRKLFYTGKSEYLDKSRDDSFLAALAEGGYQVGELAKLMYPAGVTIEELDHQIALEKTQELLKRDQVVIFEAAFVHGNLFIRVDILKKTGNRIELIEVKAKSYRQSDDGDFRGARGGIKTDFLPYLQDVAFLLVLHGCDDRAEHTRSKRDDSQARELSRFRFVTIWAWSM